MASPPQAPQPQPSFPMVLNSGQPTQAWAEYLKQLDATVRSLTSLLLGAPTQLTNAPNDAAAAAAGVKIGQLYRSGSQVMVRVA